MVGAACPQAARDPPLGLDSNCAWTVSTQGPDLGGCGRGESWGMGSPRREALRDPQRTVCPQPPPGQAQEPADRFSEAWGTGGTLAVLAPPGCLGPSGLRGPRCQSRRGGDTLP